MRERSRLSLLTLFFIAATATAGVAQQGGTVPEEFLRAIVSAEAELLIGALPADLAATLSLPDGARVIGSVVRDDRSMATAYLTLARDPEASFAFFRQQMLDAGWRTPPEREPPRGFRTPGPETFSGVFCAPDGEHLSLSAADDAGNTVAHLTYYSTYPAISPCDRPTRPRGLADDLQERMPVLNVPRDELRERGGMGSSMGAGRESAWTSVELNSGRRAAEIAAGLAGQLEAEGWVPTSTADDERASLRTWFRTFDDGFEANGSLMVVELGPGVYEAIFRIRTPPEG
jgi:hypothetical protein